MAAKKLRFNTFGRLADWVGNNAAFTCPREECSKVYLVSSYLHRSGRECPLCGQSKAYVKGSPKTGGKAWVELI